MNCPDCSAELLEGAVFCHACGKRVAPSDPPRSRSRRREEADPDQLKTAIKSREIERARQRLQALSPDDPEIELWRGTFSAKAMVNHWIAAILITFVAPIGVVLFAPPSQQNVWPICLGGIVAMWLILFAILGYRKLDVFYKLTNQRLVHKSGILRRITNRIEAIDIDDVTVEQGIIERLLGVGTIRVISSDQTSPVVVMRGIDNVFEVAQLIDEARRAERIRRGLHIEAV